MNHITGDQRMGGQNIDGRYCYETGEKIKGNATGVKIAYWDKEKWATAMMKSGAFVSEKVIDKNGLTIRCDPRNHRESGIEIMIAQSEEIDQYTRRKDPFTLDNPHKINYVALEDAIKAMPITIRSLLAKCYQGDESMWAILEEGWCGHKSYIPAPWAKEKFMNDVRHHKTLGHLPI